MLAKERAQSSSLPYGSYLEKFNQAAAVLLGFDRELARVIRALIAFHYNHFADAARLHPNGRVGMAAARFDAWVVGRLDVAAAVLERDVPPSAEDKLWLRF